MIGICKLHVPLLENLFHFSSIHRKPEVTVFEQIHLVYELSI